jgi:putative ABC transport system permease protein
VRRRELTLLADLRVRVRALLRRDTVERELEDELRFHLENEIDRHVQSGMSRADAERRARMEFGGVEQVKEDCRDVRGIGPIDALAQDLRYGWRTMRHAPVFSITAVLTIALSTGALATVFTLAYTLFFRPLAADRPGEVVVVSATRGGPRTDGVVSYPDYVTFRDRTTTLSGLAAHYSTAPLFVTANDDAKEMNGAVVSANYFPLLGLTPELGRFFHTDEDRVPDRDRVAVIGHTLWRDAFGASANAIGATLTINGVAFTVIGVAPQTVVAITPVPIEVYIPMMMLRVGYRWCDDALAASCATLSMIGRLAPGRTPADAAAEFPTLMPASWARAPKGQNSGVVVTQRRGMSEDDGEPQLVRLLAGVAIALLLVSCANLGGLLSAQSAARAGEFGIRLSLGAAAHRIIRQVMTESLMLAAIGGVAGVALSRVFIGVLAATFYSIDDEGHPLRYDFSLTPSVAVAAIAAALAAGCLFSIIPALTAVRGSGPARVQSQSRSIASRWSSAWLIGAQAAVAVALVAVTGLLTASAQLMLAGNNFDASHVALMRLRPRLVKYAPERAQQFQRAVIRQLETMPGVESVSLVGTGAVLGGGQLGIALPGWTPDQRLRVHFNEIGANYFATLRTPMVGGREFDDRDSLRSPPVAIVNETLAARLWPDGRAIGETLIVRNAPLQVVGVVKDVPLVSRADAIQPWAFAAFWQNPAEVDSRLAIRVAGDPAAALPALVHAVNRIDPDVPIAETITLPIQIRGWMRPLRVSATFVGYAAALAMLLTAIGLYGTLAFSVSRRTKEIGIRMALGAARARVSGLIVREGMAVVLAGAVVGLALAAAGSRLVVHLLYRSATPDWLFFAAAALLVALVGLLASLIPARRAAAVEPLVALRHD